MSDIKDVVGFENLFECNRKGDVFSKERIQKVNIHNKFINRIKHRQLLKTHINKKTDYESFCGFVNGKKTLFLVHRVIATTFIPNPENKPQVNHKNGIKTDNRVENLEWVTASENKIHSLNTLSPNIAKGNKLPQAKLNEMQVRIIRRMKGDMSQPKIAEYFNVSRESIRDIINRKNWKHI